MSGLMAAVPGLLDRIFLSPEPVRACPAMQGKDLVGIFVEQKDSLYAYMAALAGDPAVAEEAFQELGLCVMREAARGTEPDNVAAWLRGLARNRVMDRFRTLARQRGHERRFDDLAAAVDLAFDEHADEPAFDEGDAGRLRTCLQKLAPRARQLIDQRYQHGHDSARIASDLGWSANAVKVALSKARKALGECLQRLRAQAGVP